MESIETTTAGGHFGVYVLLSSVNRWAGYQLGT